MSISLVAVFFPILLLGGIVGKIFHEFAVTLTIAIAISLIVSLTVTPMMCAYLDIRRRMTMKAAFCASSRRIFEASQDFYRRTLGWALDNPKTIMFILLVAVVLNVYLLAIVPKGFFPSVDEGRMQGGIRADQSISFQLMQKKFMQFVNIIRADPAVAVGRRLRRRRRHQYRQYLCHPQVAGPARLCHHRRGDRPAAARARQCRRRAAVPAIGQRHRRARRRPRRAMATINIPSRPTRWTISTPGCPRSPQALQNVPELQDVNSDQQDKGLEVDLKIDRPTAARLGLNASQIDSRCMTRSASARSRPSTRTRTSIMW